MSDNVWQRFRQWLSPRQGPHDSFPPPRVEGEAQGRAVRAALQALLARNENRYRSLFLKSNPLDPVPEESGWFDTLAAAGYVEKAGSTIRPCVRVFFLGDLFIATDLLAHDGEDQVFSLMLEQVFLYRVLDVRKGEHVLELCLGSGVNSILMSRRGAARVVGVDISPRALAFTTANAAVNLAPGDTPVEMRLGSLFEPLKPDDRFDLILINPPFEPVPPGARYYLHSHGGEDGLDLVRVFLPQVPNWLRPDGRFEMYTCALGDADTEQLSELMLAAFPGFRIEMRRADRFTLDEVYDRFRHEPECGPWRARLSAKGLTYVWGLHVRAYRAEPPGLVLMDAAADVRASDATVARWTKPPPG